MNTFKKDSKNVYIRTADSLSPIPSTLSAVSTPENKHPELPVAEIYKWNTPLISSVAEG
jgi:hypothetical protein